MEFKKLSFKSRVVILTTSECKHWESPLNIKPRSSGLGSFFALVGGNFAPQIFPKHDPLDIEKLSFLIGKIKQNKAKLYRIRQVIPII